MLKPAIVYKDILEKKFGESVYSERFYYYSGYAAGNEIPNITLRDCYYQWACVDPNGEVTGWFAYYIDFPAETACNFGLFSFTDHNPLLIKDVLDKMEELVKTYRRVEWRVVGGNFVEKYYDQFCRKHHGNKVTMHAVSKDLQGNYRDSSVYEIIKGEFFEWSH